MLTSTRRSHNLGKLRYSSQKNGAHIHGISYYVKPHNHIASTSKHYHLERCNTTTISIIMHLIQIDIIICITNITMQVSIIEMLE